MDKHRLEARILIESTGNYVTDDPDVFELSVDDVMEVYDKLMEHLGFEDTRRDKRYVVKFHDIFYYTPEEYINTDEFEAVFETFCEVAHEDIAESLKEDNCKVKRVCDSDLLSNRYVGNYRPFMVDIPEISIDNAAQLAMDLIEELSYPDVAAEYVEAYITIVTRMKEWEESYMEYWVDLLKGNEYASEEIIEQIENNIKKAKEKKQWKI